MINSLEWTAFLLALLSCLLYGKSVRAGASVGIISALFCIVWGLMKPVPAAVFTNVGFLLINGFNLWRAHESSNHR